MPGRDEVPSTLKRSPDKAERTWVAAHDSAVEQYGEGERAHRTAFSAVKHSYEKVGDHWEPKERRGPSDDQDARTGEAARRSSEPTAGGVDARASKQHLYEVATRLGVRGRSRMTKAELVEAIERANDRATAAARR
jgi:cation transport regulator ChaB